MRYYLDLWTRFLDRFKKTGADPDVTHYVLSLGSQHATTGIYAKSYAGGAMIQMVIAGRSTATFLSGMGVFVRADAVGVTDSAVSEGDKIEDAGGTYYQVETVKPHKFGGTLIFYEAQLRHLPFHA